MLLSYIRTLLLYLLLIVTVRLMGKRQIGQMEPSEFVVAMLLANLAAIPMQDGDISLAAGLVPILTVLGAELVLASLSLRSIPLRRLLCGKPVLLIDDGVICQRNLRRTRIHLDELTEHLREREIMDLSSVKYAILETNGEISTFLYARDKPATARDAGIRSADPCLPYTLISDGVLLQENLKKSGRTEAWVREELEKRSGSVRDTFLFSVDAAGKTVYITKEAGK